MLRRFFYWFYAFVRSIFVGGSENDSRSLLESEKDKLNQQVNRFNGVLATHAGLIHRLSSELKTMALKEKELSSRILGKLKTGDKKTAAQLALELQLHGKKMADGKEQLDLAEQTRLKMEKVRDAAVRNVGEKLAQIEREISETEALEAQVGMQNLARELSASVTTVDRSIGSVKRFLEEPAGRSFPKSSAGNNTKIETPDDAEAAEKALRDFEARGLPEETKPD